jgi:integrase
VVVTKVFNNAVTKAGIRTIRFHDLRHTFKTLFLDDGANPLAVEKLMGHKLPAMMERYWHPNPIVLLETVKRLDRILGMRSTQQAEAVTG